MKKWKCTVCGHVFEGDTPPVPCPVCSAGEEAFELVQETGPVRWHCTVCNQIFEGAAPPVPCPVCGAGESAFERVVEEAVTFQLDTQDSFLLVGGGFASLEAARAIRTRNKTAQITIVCEENHLPYNRPALSDVVADGLSFANILLEEEDWYAANQVALRRGVKVEQINTEAKTARLSNGESLGYTKLLLATGSWPFNPIKQEAGSVPVVALRTFEDAQRLIAAAMGKKVVIVGGGILGLEAALGLRERGCEVTVVEFSPRILHIQSDAAVSAMLTKKLQGLGITIITGCSVQSTGPAGATLSTGEIIAADAVVASMGVRSEVTLATQMGLALNRGVVVDGFMHTSHPDVWAAGDCAEFKGSVLALAGVATAMGAVAGASMAGDETTAYVPFVAATALEFPGFNLFSVGDVKEDCVESVQYANTYTGEYRRLFMQKGKLAGAVFVGQSPAAKAVRAVAEGHSLAQALALLG